MAVDADKVLGHFEETIMAAPNNQYGLPRAQDILREVQESVAEASMKTSGNHFDEVGDGKSLGDNSGKEHSDSSSSSSSSSSSNNSNSLSSSGNSDSPVEGRQSEGEMPSPVSSGDIDTDALNSPF
jgi:hypothetical protein